MAMPDLDRVVSGDELPLSSRDFRFVDHKDPERFFAADPRPLRLIRRSPELTTYDNAIYVPASRGQKEALGCLYDADLTRIEATITRRGRDDRPNTELSDLTIESGSLAPS